MAKLTAKQVDGADTTSSQEVTGQKTFSSAQAFTGRINPLYWLEAMYWVSDPTVLNHDTRIQFINGQMLLKYTTAIGWQYDN